MRLLALCLLPVLVAGSPVAAEEPPDPAAFVKERCGACHETRPGRASGFLSRRRSLQEMADDPATTADGLRSFLATPHVGIDALRLEPEQVETVVGYVMGLR